LDTTLCTKGGPLFQHFKGFTMKFPSFLTSRLPSRSRGREAAAASQPHPFDGPELHEEEAAAPPHTNAQSRSTHYARQNSSDSSGRIRMQRQGRADSADSASPAPSELDHAPELRAELQDMLGNPENAQGAAASAAPGTSHAQAAASVAERQLRGAFEDNRYTRYATEKTDALLATLPTPDNPHPAQPYQPHPSAEVLRAALACENPDAQQRSQIWEHTSALLGHSPELLNRLGDVFGLTDVPTSPPTEGLGFKGAQAKAADAAWRQCNLREGIVDALLALRKECSPGAIQGRNNGDALITVCQNAPMPLHLLLLNHSKGGTNGPDMLGLLEAATGQTVGDAQRRLAVCSAGRRLGGDVESIVTADMRNYKRKIKNLFGLSALIVYAPVTLPMAIHAVRRSTGKGALEKLARDQPISSQTKSYVSYSHDPRDPGLLGAMRRGRGSSSAPHAEFTVISKIAETKTKLGLSPVECRRDDPDLFIPQRRPREMVTPQDFALSLIPKHARAQVNGVIRALEQDMDSPDPLPLLTMLHSLKRGSPGTIYNQIPSDKVMTALVMRLFNEANASDRAVTFNLPCLDHLPGRFADEKTKDATALFAFHQVHHTLVCKSASEAAQASAAKLLDSYDAQASPGECQMLAAQYRSDLGDLMALGVTDFQRSTVRRGVEALHEANPAAGASDKPMQCRAMSELEAAREKINPGAATVLRHIPINRFYNSRYPHNSAVSQVVRKAVDASTDTVAAFIRQEWLPGLGLGMDNKVHQRAAALAMRYAPPSDMPESKAGLDAQEQHFQHLAYLADKPAWA
jgi:hypothetical protein